MQHRLQDRTSALRRGRTEAVIDSVVATGFVEEAKMPQRAHPDDAMEGLTIEVPRRLKRALQGEVARRRDDPERRSVASMEIRHT